ncbi:hypothetical protein [Actinomadura decatromicini]|uniref:TOMM leader peptide-binding protein n=1 Tax=Actinomadura decatromicini TaxID=2604572 RepID=A0A5D3FRC7_9ACTN|nr:hypothetical protein [Actinomadura decatromicini]TYK50614.1 hypothetical protein FXF68_08880 [Actinomadura decatromicini]
MADSELMRTVLVAASDVEVRFGDAGGKCEIAVGPRAFSLAAGEDSLDALAEVLLRVVPRLRRAAPAAEQLSAAEVATLEPYVERFREMGVLLFPGDEVVIDDEPGRRLYSYVARRAADPDRAFMGVRAKRIVLRGPEHVVSVWGRLLSEQAIQVEQADEEADLNIVVASDEEVLMAVNRALCSARRNWVPVVFSPQSVRIGPWVKAGESGCLRCFVPPDTAAGKERSARPGWATMQAGSLHWTGGLLSHLALNALLPMGAEHPWGRVTTVDVVAGEQRSVTTWRDPFCDDCGERSVPHREWVTL